jgi:hypothetical protein
MPEHNRPTSIRVPDRSDRHFDPYSTKCYRDSVSTLVFAVWLIVSLMLRIHELMKVSNIIANRDRVRFFPP